MKKLSLLVGLGYGAYAFENLVGIFKRLEATNNLPDKVRGCGVTSILSSLYFSGVKLDTIINRIQGLPFLNDATTLRGIILNHLTEQSILNVQAGVYFTRSNQSKLLPGMLDPILASYGMPGLDTPIIINQENCFNGGFGNSVIFNTVKELDQYEKIILVYFADARCNRNGLANFVVNMFNDHSKLALLCNHTPWWYQNDKVKIIRLPQYKVELDNVSNWSYNQSAIEAGYRAAQEQLV